VRAAVFAFCLGEGQRGLIAQPIDSIYPFFLQKTMLIAVDFGQYH
jgi:hypothetical protein